MCPKCRELLGKIDSNDTFIEFQRNEIAELKKEIVRLSADPGNLLTAARCASQYADKLNLKSLHDALLNLKNAVEIHTK